jgi:uncharacterized cupredoxin-like copper-binding protein
MRGMVILVPLALLLSACGGSSTTSGGGGQVLRTLQISEREFSLTPGNFTVSKPGAYEFKVTNNGTTTHAFEVEGNGVEEKTGDIEPGASATLRVELSKDGSYEIYCPIDGHRQQGMEGKLTVGIGGASGGATTTEQQTTTSKGYGY